MHKIKSTSHLIMVVDIFVFMYKLVINLSDRVLVMDDSIMYVWTVFSTDTHGDQSTEFVCARKRVAEYLRDWFEAIEDDRVRSIAMICNRGVPFSHGRRVSYEIEESEVIL